MHPATFPPVPSYWPKLWKPCKQYDRLFQGISNINGLVQDFRNSSSGTLVCQQWNYHSLVLSHQYPLYKISPILSLIFLSVSSGPREAWWQTSYAGVQGGPKCVSTVLPWIFPGAPLKVNGAPGNIQGNFDRYRYTIPEFALMQKSAFFMQSWEVIGWGAKTIIVHVPWIIVSGVSHMGPGPHFENIWCEYCYTHITCVFL